MNIANTDNSSYSRVSMRASMREALKLSLTIIQNTRENTQNMSAIKKEAFFTQHSASSLIYNSYYKHRKIHQPHCMICYRPIHVLVL